MRKIKVGLDFDGVVAYNPFRIIRAPIKWFKREVLGVRKLTFFVPKNWWQRLLWTVIHESSIVPARGFNRLRELAKRDDVELYLITARFGFLKSNLENWLKKYRAYDLFKSININENCEQPHEYKLRLANELNLDYYIEDNLDIVVYLKDRVKAKVFWIYNLMDRRHPYPDKFPCLEEALKEVEI